MSKGRARDCIVEKQEQTAWNGKTMIALKRYRSPFNKSVGVTVEGQMNCCDGEGIAWMVEGCAFRLYSENEIMKAEFSFD